MGINAKIKRVRKSLRLIQKATIGADGVDVRGLYAEARKAIANIPRPLRALRYYGAEDRVRMLRTLMGLPQ